MATTMKRPSETDVSNWKHSTPAALGEWQRAVLTELRAIRVALERQQRRPVATLSREDRAVLARLLPAIGGALGSDEFFVWELLEHNAAALQLVRRGLNLNAIRIGRLFQRAEGQVIDGYVIERTGDERHTTLWRVVEVPGSGLPPVPPVPPGGLA